MAGIYLNGKEKEILTNVKNQLTNQNEINFIESLLAKNEIRRVHNNKVASEYKKRKRAENKEFARSKTEIENSIKARNKCNEE